MSETSPPSALPPPGPPAVTRPWAAPVAPADVRPTARGVRPGRLTAAWRTMMVVTWVGVFLAYLAVWKTSEELGLGTWWLGPASAPQPILVRLVPFYVAAFFGILASYNVPRMSALALVGVAMLAAIAVPDLSRSTGLAAIEFAIAGAVALVAVASFTGVQRRARTHDAG